MPEEICYLAPEEARQGCVKELLYQAQTHCEECNGSGRKGLFRCKSCQGAGEVTQTLRLQVSVLPETAEGAELTYTVLPDEAAELLPPGYNVRAAIRENSVSGTELGDAFAQFFGKPPGNPPPQPASGDINHQLIISAAEAKWGGSYFFTYKINNPCPDCQGSGAAGAEEALACPRCGGIGFTAATEQVEVIFPAGMGRQTVTYPEKGHYLEQNKRGSLILTVSVQDR